MVEQEEKEIVCFFLSNKPSNVLLEMILDSIREILPEAEIHQQDFTLTIDRKATLIIRLNFANVVEIAYRYPVMETEKYSSVIYQVGGKFDVPTYMEKRR